MKLQLDRFDPASLPLGSISLVQGRRNTGKSTILKSLMFAVRSKIDCVVAMTPTQSSVDFFRSVMPTALVYEKGIDVGVIEAMLTMQRELISKGKRRELLLILDDVSYDKASFRSPVLGDAWRNGRHAAVTIMMTSQACFDIPPDLRSNTDIIFALRDPILTNRKKLHAAYFGQLPFDAFSQCFEACTAQYGAVVLNQTVPTNEPSECLFWFRAKPSLPSFKMCSKAIWKTAQRPPPPQHGESQLQVIVAPPKRAVDASG
jgi:hypothetical protein